MSIVPYIHTDPCDINNIFIKIVNRYEDDLQNMNIMSEQIS